MMPTLSMTHQWRQSWHYDNSWFSVIIGKKFPWNLNEHTTIFIQEIGLKMSSAKGRLFCLGFGPCVKKRRRCHSQLLLTRLNISISMGSSTYIRSWSIVWMGNWKQCKHIRPTERRIWSCEKKLPIASLMTFWNLLNQCISTVVF